MSKTCPNCGVNSPDNAKFCIECAESLEGVPINKEEKPPQKSEESDGSVALGCGIMIVIAAIIIVAVGFLFLGWGFFDKMPKDIEKYMVKTKYIDSRGNELTSSSKRLSDFKNDVNHDFSSTLSFYQTQNYIDVDHVCVQIIKDNQVVQEFNSTMNKNKLTTIPNSGNTSK